ncbi:LytS/YhcK type 5TM receptor domain-containing protein [Brevibacillus daliensis]|uniref:LytS/YhcK type 5TM receptor domain-containing protein n=1 Tax=Brevibacillus daliensis TaxID=2892995 RepID=UPI001E5CEEBB|nr:LytS/YhcK type 5TM receptor domain-containing protein [Brevibacillus daliensis]
MEQLTLLLVERMGLLLLLTFILTRIPLFRQLLDREIRFHIALVFSLLFGLFGIAGTYAGVMIDQGQPMPAFWIHSLSNDQAIANSTSVGVVIGGLLGGPMVGAGAGIISATHYFQLGGFISAPVALSLPFIGLLAGFIARFFSQERVISPSKALFIGMFAPILQMGFILVGASPKNNAIFLVDQVGIPMVFTNSIAIAIFTAMIHLALKEEERSAVLATASSFTIAEYILPHLKQGLTQETALVTAKILLRECKVSAVSVSNNTQVLAHVGQGSSYHTPGELQFTPLIQEVMQTQEMRVTNRREQLGCHQCSCGLHAGIIVPFSVSDKTAGLIILYFRRPQQIRKIEEELAKGLGSLISYQMSAARTEQLVHLMKDAELRLLQAQINPHFLFNTLNSIVTLIRLNPDQARHVTVQLGTFMRLNLKITDSKLVTLQQELDHLRAFLEIIQIRFDDQFSIQLNLDANLEEIFIPPSTLQPLIENCIHHGLREKTHGGIIILTVLQQNGSARISIEDNGTGIPPALLQQLGTYPLEHSSGNGIGVYNVNQRLINLLGATAKLHIENKTEGGSRTTFYIPVSGQKGRVS